MPFALSSDKDADIMVSVAMPTYNHEEYIAQAIESVLMQKVNFRYELVIAEDRSTDGTRQIVLKYKERYPKTIRLVLQPVNVGRKKNGLDLKNNCTGKYIARLEGDDYWTDVNKLQKQVDFLENNLDYSAVYHNVTTINKFGKEIKGSLNHYPYRKEHTVNFSKYTQNLSLVGQTASLVYRNFWKSFTAANEKAYHNCKTNGDQKLFLELLFQGKVFFMSDIMAKHRKIIQGGDSWSAQTYGKNMVKFHYDSYKSLIEYAYLRKKIVIDHGILKKMLMESLAWTMESTTKENIKTSIDITCDYARYVLKKGLKARR